MAAIDVVVPIIANIHWDSILKEFVLRITTMLESNQGNTREEERFKLEDFASVLLKIYEIWVIAHAENGYLLDFPIGDFNLLQQHLITIMSSIPAPAENTVPASYVDSSSPDFTGWTDVTDFGVTP